MKKRDVWRFAVVTAGILCLGFSSAQGQEARRQRPQRPGVEKQAGVRERARLEAMKARFLEELSRDDGRPMDPDRRRALLRRYLQQRRGDQQGARRGQGQGWRQRFRQSIPERKGQEKSRVREQMRRRQAQGGVLPERLREYLKEQASKGRIDPERMKAILARIARNHPEAARMLRQRLKQRQGDAPIPVPRGGGKPAQRPSQEEGTPRARKAPATPEDAVKRIEAMEKRIQALKKRLNEAKKAAGQDG